MKWESLYSKKLIWTNEIQNRESKLRTAYKLIDNINNGQVIGVGSGSTAYLALIEISKYVKDKKLDVKFIPSSKEIEITCCVLGLETTSLVTFSPDWVFDGADEVDNYNNLIKGRGGALFREKMLIVNAPKVFILIDQSKFVNALGEKFPVPVEIVPDSIHFVTNELSKLGASNINLRMAKQKDGPVITEYGNLLLDCNFKHIGKNLEKQIKTITGVIDSGLFINYKVEIIVS